MRLSTTPSSPMVQDVLLRDPRHAHRASRSLALYISSKAPSLTTQSEKIKDRVSKSKYSPRSCRHITHKKVGYSTMRIHPSVEHCKIIFKREFTLVIHRAKESLISPKIMARKCCLILFYLYIIFS
jgi:hypothetical protein